MNFELDAPPVDVLKDMEQLEATLVNDLSGDRTRRLLQFLSEAELDSQQKRLRTTDFEERTFAGMVADAFAASRRILIRSWQKVHQKDLIL